MCGVGLRVEGFTESTVHAYVNGTVLSATFELSVKIAKPSSKQISGNTKPVIGLAPTVKIVVAVSRQPVFVSTCKLTVSFPN